MKPREDSEEYKQLFISFSNKVQRNFRRAFVLLLVCLCLCQLLLRIPGIKYYLSSAERWEGERVRSFPYTYDYEKEK